MSDLQGLMNHIAALWKCGPERYPALRGMSPAQRKIFLTKHSLLHMDKHMGNIAAVGEAYDHTDILNPAGEEKLKTETAKMFVSVLKLAEELDMDAAELLKRAPSLVK